MYWESCIKRRDCYYRTSSIGYWGKGSTVGWYKVDMAKRAGWVELGSVRVGSIGLVGQTSHGSFLNGLIGLWVRLGLPVFFK